MARLRQAYLDYFYLDKLKYTAYQLKDNNRHEGDLARQGEKLSVGAGHYLRSRPDKIRGTTATGHGFRINLHKITAWHGVKR